MPVFFFHPRCHGLSRFLFVQAYYEIPYVLSCHVLCSPACDNLMCLTCVNYPTCVWFLPLVLNLSVFPLSVFILCLPLVLEYSSLVFSLCVPASCLSSCFIVQQITYSLHHTSLCVHICAHVFICVTLSLQL